MFHVTLLLFKLSSLPIQALSSAKRLRRDGVALKIQTDSYQIPFFHKCHHSHFHRLVLYFIVSAIISPDKPEREVSHYHSVVYEALRWINREREREEVLFLTSCNWPIHITMAGNSPLMV